MKGWGIKGRGCGEQLGAASIEEEFYPSPPGSGMRSKYKIRISKGEGGGEERGEEMRGRKVRL